MKRGNYWLQRGGTRKVAGHSIGIISKSEEQRIINDIMGKISVAEETLPADELDVEIDRIFAIYGM